MEAFLAFEDLAATAGHIDLVQAKLDKLTAVKEDAWAQVLTAAARLYRADELTTAHLLQLHRDMKLSYGPGFTCLWNRVIPVKSSQLPHFAARERRIAEERARQSWHGTFPLDGSYSVPSKGVACVYILFDKTDVPAYIGSTEQFRTRMGNHRRERPDIFVRWVCYTCENREAAYELEVRLLAENLPYLNRKVGR